MASSDPEEAADRGIFGGSDNLRNSITIVNGIAVGKLPKLLQRVLDKLHLPNDKPFSAEEEDALTAAFELDADQVSLLLGTIAFIFETAAYHDLEAEALLEHLTGLGMQAAQGTIWGKAWAAKGGVVVKNLRDRAFFVTEATNVNWRLNLQLAQSSQSKMKTPNAMFEISVLNKSGEKDEVQVEFDRTQLAKFYTQLEIVQEQLDHLT